LYMQNIVNILFYAILHVQYSVDMYVSGYLHI